MKKNYIFAHAINRQNIWQHIRKEATNQKTKKEKEQKLLRRTQLQLRCLIP